MNSACANRTGSRQSPAISSGEESASTVQASSPASSTRAARRAASSSTPPGGPPPHTDLSPQTCKALRHLDRVDFTCLERGDCGFRQFDAAWAAHTLAHEAFHLRGFQDEGVTECYALQNTAFVAERLGVSAERAEQLQAWIYARGYPNEPEEYHSAQCYSGGPLDLRPNVAKFP